MGSTASNIRICMDLNLERFKELNDVILKLESSFNSFSPEVRGSLLKFMDNYTCKIEEELKKIHQVRNNIYNNMSDDDKVKFELDEF